LKRQRAGCAAPLMSPVVPRDTTMPKQRQQTTRVPSSQKPTRLVTDPLTESRVCSSPCRATITESRENAQDLSVNASETAFCDNPQALGEGLLQLVAAGRVQDFARKQSLWPHSDQDNQVAVLLSGVVMAKAARFMDALPVQLYGRGDIIGIGRALGVAGKGVDYECLDDVSVCMVSVRAVESVLATDHAFALRVAGMLAKQSAAAHELALLARAPAAVRVVGGVCMLAGVAGGQNRAALGVRAQDVVRLRMDRTVASHVCGVSRSYSWPIFDQLRRHGWLTLGYRVLAVNQPAVWRSAATRMLEEPVAKIDEVLACFASVAQQPLRAPTAAA
jgi:CRP-like cAMP-binding protein